MITNTESETSVSPTASTAPFDDPATTAELEPIAISMPLGLPGYEKHTTWLIEAGQPFFWFSAKDEPGLRGAIARAADVVPHYGPLIKREDVKFLDLKDPAEAEMLLLVAWGEDGKATVNLKAPIIFNLRTFVGRQVIPANVAEYSENHVLVAGAADSPPASAETPKPKTYWTCQERHKVQQRLDGRVRACCMLPNVHWPAADAFRLKRELNENMTKGEFGVCKGCVFLRETNEKPNDVPVMIDIMTNSFCSVRCWYCSYTIPGGLADAPAELRQDKCGVSQHVLNTQDIPTFIREFSAASGGQLKWISLSGGDSAFHPQFQEIVRTASEVGATLVYLSAGILPPKTENFCIEEIRAGRMFLSISPDAAKGETWSKIKRMNAKLWPQLVSFVSRAALANSNQVIVKRILLPDNLGESDEFIQFWYSQGLRRFALSALFGNEEKQLSRQQCDEAIADSKRTVAELQKAHGQYLHLETIAV